MCDLILKSSIQRTSDTAIPQILVGPTLGRARGPCGSLNDTARSLNPFPFSRLVIVMTDKSGPILVFKGRHFTGCHVIFFHHLPLFDDMLFRRAGSQLQARDQSHSWDTRTSSMISTGKSCQPTSDGIVLNFLARPFCPRSWSASSRRAENHVDSELARKSCLSEKSISCSQVSRCFHCKFSQRPNPGKAHQPDGKGLAATAANTQAKLRTADLLDVMSILGTIDFSGKACSTSETAFSISARHSPVQAAVRAL